MASTHPSQAETCIRKLTRDLARRQRAAGAANRAATSPAAAILLHPYAAGTLDRDGFA